MHFCLNNRFSTTYFYFSSPISVPFTNVKKVTVFWLRYNWNVTLYLFQLYNLMTQYLYIMQNDHHSKCSQRPSPQLLFFFLWRELLRSTLFSLYCLLINAQCPECPEYVKPCTALGTHIKVQRLHSQDVHFWGCSSFSIDFIIDKKLG